MWEGVSQLQESYEVRRSRRYPEKYQRPLSEREKEIIAAVRARGSSKNRNGNGGAIPKTSGSSSGGSGRSGSGGGGERPVVVDLPIFAVTKEYGCTRAERRLVWDELYGTPVSQRPPMREPRDLAAESKAAAVAAKAKKRPQYSYMDLVRCGGRTSTLAARKKKEKPKPKFRSYTEARKDREKFRKKLVEIIMHRDEWDDEDEEPASAGAPLTTKEKDLLRYYYYIHNGIDTRYVASINHTWFKRIMMMVPKRLQRNQKEIKKIHDEIKDDYLFAVKKSIVDFVLKEPEIDEDERFLDEDDETPLTIELARVSNAWRKIFRQSKKHLRFNLFTINHCLLQTLGIWFRSYDKVRFISSKEMKLGPKLELIVYQDQIYQRVEKVKLQLKEQWLKAIYDIYRNCQKKKQLPPEPKLPGLLRCLSVQMTNSLQSLCLESMSEFDTFVRHLGSEETEKQRAGFVLSLKAVNNKIIFYPTFQDVENAILETYDIMIKAGSEIPRFEHLLETEEEEKPICLRPTILENIISEMKATVRENVAEQRKHPEEYIRDYDKFIYLIDGKAEAEVDAYIQEPREFEELSERVRFFDELSTTLTSTLPKEVNLGMFELHCEDLIQNLNRKTTVLRERVLKKMSVDHQNENKRLCAEFEEISSMALSSPNNTEELVQLKEKVDHIRSVVMKEKELELNKAAKRLVFLSDYLQFTTAEMKLNTKTFQFHAKMPKVFDEHQSIIKEKTTEYQKALKLRRDRFIEELEASNLQVDDFYTFGNVDDLPKYMKKAQTLSTKLNLCKEKIQQFNMEEDAFEWEKTNYPLWQATVDKLNPFLGLYETSMEFMNKQITWFESSMGTHDPQDIENEVNSSWELVARLENEFSDIPAARELVINVREKIEEFRSKMPVIKTLGNPGFRERHWENVSNTVGFPVKGGFNLFQILDMGLDEYVRKFQKISEAATKEYNLEKLMEQMVNDWADMEFTITAYGDTGTFTLSSVDNIQVLLDDHIVKTQTMRGSPYIKPFEEQIGKWEVQLLLLQEIMDEWLKVQSIWLYLEPIFGSPDIMAQMPEEGRRFTTVDKNWRDIMKAAIIDKHVLKVVEIDRILEKLKKSNELLDLIGKGLNDYLERKRQCFPRFFFLSNSELLEILSETKDPTRVQTHLKKCFEGIASLEFDEDMELTKMCSATGEVVPLTKPISTAKARGQVDKWLCELEVQMRQSLRKAIEDAMGKYGREEIYQLCGEHPSQALLCVNYIHWTAKTQEGIKAGNEAALKSLQDDNVGFMSTLSGLVLQEPCPVKSQTFANILLTQGYFADFLSDGIQNETFSTDDFAWLSKLRYYFGEDSVELRMMYSTIPYGYEYLSSYSKLVMTPLTERCYQILLIALDTNQGGLVSGETATGKTETIKDFAKSVAKQCVGFNCSEEFHYKAFSKFLKGLASCGAWSCFDEFHRVDRQVLSVIAQQILTIQRALHSNLGQLDFEGSVIKISRGCALFVTTDSLQSEGQHIPDNLKALFRPVAMANPDFALIAELTLKSKGFQNARTLAKKIASMVELCDGLLSSQPHYEFGLRSIISILNSAGTLKKQQQEQDEHYLVSLALQRVKYCELLPQDQKMFRDILAHLFFQCPPDPLPDDVLKKAIIEQCGQNELESTPHFLSKVQQLYDMMDLSDGLMLLGEPYGGKTMAWKVLAASLKVAQESTGITPALAPACVVLNPKAVRIDQLYGYFENDEWRDGILARNFRQFSSLPMHQRKWLVFDGPVDSEWIESMNTVLDENKKLCLMSGEIIQLPPKTNLIFEATDVESASPATISRCGILYMDPQCLQWSLIVKTWIRKFPKSIPEAIREKLWKLFDRFCIPLLKLVKKYANLKVSEHHLITSLVNLFDCYLLKLIDGSELKGMSEHEQTPLFEGIFFFSCVWSIGAFCDTSTKLRFNQVFRELLSGDLSDEIKSDLNMSFEIPMLKKPYVFPLPTTGTVFEYKLVMGTKPEWTRWEEDIDSNAPLSRDIYACQLVIPNVHTVRYNFLMNLLVSHNKPFLLVGAPGTGKSVYMKDFLQRKLDVDKYASVSLFFSSHTNPGMTQDIIVNSLDKRRKGVYGPPLGKSFIVFIDDINMPDKDDVGSQPPIELLRQLLDHKTWFDNKELFPMKLIEMMVVGTMRPPDGSSNALSSRFMRHFNTLYLDHLEDETVVTIFSRVVLWHLDTKGFSKEFDPCIEQIVQATLAVHKFVVKNLLPTPYHTHYIFSLKEFSRIVCGLLLSVPETMEDLNAMKRLWVHETLRVYCDRLVYDTDRASFLSHIKAVCNEKLKIPFNELCSRLGNAAEDGEVTENDLRRLLFCDFSDPKNDDKFYKEIIDMDAFRKVTESLLTKYNSVSRKPMDLVMFNFALEHLCRISRVFKQPESHILLVGVGGSGRQSLSRLAAHIAGYDFHEVEVVKDEGSKGWRAQIKGVLKKMSQTLHHHVLFLYDNQMTQESFIEDVNNIILSGEIPLLFSADERQEIIDNMRSLEKQLDKSVHTDGSGPALFSLFVRRVKENIHVVFAMSPFSDAFRQNIAKFPGLLNCCTINWVHQWPDDALHFVSNKILGSITFNEGELEACVEMCEFFHTSTIKLSKNVRRKHDLYNYVTPASFLEMNSLFKTLLLEHRLRVEETKKMYEVSLEKLKGAEGQVAVMQEEMAAVQPNLSEASQEVDAYMAMVDKEQVEVSELEKVVKAEDATVGEKKKVVESISNDLDSEFSEVNGVLETALDSIASLSQSELAVVRGVKSPSTCLKLNLEALCLIKGIKPDRIPDSSAGGKMVEDYWGPSKRLLGDPKFVEGMSNFDRESINPKTAKLVREKYIGHAEFNPDKIKSSMPALDTVARAIYCWIIAVDMYEKVARNVAPKKEAMARAESDHQDALEQLNRKKQKLKEVQEKLRDIHDNLQQKKQKKAELENEVDLCTRKLERAEQLITGFGGEREKWAFMSETLQNKYQQLIGDILLAAGMVAYLGVFPREERQMQIKDWMAKAAQLNITFSPDWSLVSVLGNPIVIQTWYMNGLLRDDFSTENGLMLSTAKRWVLMVDPQDIANRWIKTTEKNKNLTVLKQSDKDFLRTLENCIQFGSPVLLENVGDSLDPALEPLLQKQTFQQGGSVCIKLGESTIEYSKDFRMYMTTRLRNPHFPPETTAKIAMVNFSITKAGLVDQLLGIIVARERPELEEERTQVSTQINENKKSLEEIENKILNVLYSSKGNILEDENAIKNLSSSKVMSNEIIEKQQISASTFSRINENRSEYLSLTNYAVTLFFSGNILSSINHMYQYSLSWFINLFCSSLDAADKSEELPERISNVKKHFLQSLFTNTSIGLFEEDKIMYSFLLTCNLCQEKNKIIGSALWKLLVTSDDDGEGEEGGPNWLSSSVKAKLSRLKQVESFKNNLTEIESSEAEWQAVWTAHEPNPDSIPYLAKLKPFKKLVFMVHYRPDKIISAMRKFVIDSLGSSFVDEEPLDIGRAYAESVAATPLIFLLGEEVDPLKYIFRYAEDSGFSGKKLKIVTMGSGQEEKAKNIIKESVHSSTWVVLLNCHMVPHWMDELEYLVDDLSLETTNPDFRLWITSRPHPEFSVPALQSGVKIALEEPITLKTNLIRHLFPDKQFAAAFSAGTTEFRRLSFVLALFHAVINERRSYSQCGWNQDYIFGETDYDLGQLQLSQMMKQNCKEFPLGTLKYLLSHCTYGGRMEDDMDMSILQTYLDEICPHGILAAQDPYSNLEQEGIYHTRELEDHESMMSYLNSLPTDVTHLLMRMSEANHRRKNELKGQAFLDKLRVAQQGLFLATSSQEDKDKNDQEDDNWQEEEEQMRAKIHAILRELPELFDLVENAEDILKLVLDQELQKYNHLLETMRETLDASLKSIDGENLVTAEIRDLLESVRQGEVPQCWKEVAYPTLENLDGFLRDLHKRTEFLRSWQTQGAPDTFWLAALFEPGDFLIVILYIHSLETGLPYHELGLECRFGEEAEKRGSGQPGILVRDLFLVGASWDRQLEQIVESGRDEIFCQMPVVRLVPVHVEEDKDDKEEGPQTTYACPLFQTSERSGEDNFVMELGLPTEKQAKVWKLAGVALLCQVPKD